MQINIYKVGHIYFSTGIGFSKYMNRPIDNFFSGSCFGGILDFILKSIHSVFFYSLRFKKVPDDYNSILTFGLSNNNRNTLKPITDVIGEKKVCSITNRRDFPMWRVYLYSYPYLFTLLKEFRNASPDNKKIIRFFFGKFWRMYGCKRMADIMIGKYKPKVLILANDHLEMNRLLMEVANDKGVKTMYVQHASVTDKFPPLQFTYSMLDGEDSFLKYKGVGGMRGNIYLSGGVRFDKVKRHDIHEINAIGLAINKQDSEKIVKEACIKLREKYSVKGIKIILRPHPAMDQELWENWCKINGIYFSCSARQSSFDFLDTLSFLISNQSSIHLDAAMNHIPSVILNMSDHEVSDHYGYKTRGLVPFVKNLEELFTIIDNVDDYKYDTGVVRFFNSSYNAPFEGKVALMIASLIDSIVEGKDINLFNKSCHFSLMESNKDYHVYNIPTIS